MFTNAEEKRNADNSKSHFLSIRSKKAGGGGGERSDENPFSEVQKEQWTPSAGGQATLKSPCSWEVVLGVRKSEGVKKNRGKRERCLGRCSNRSGTRHQCSNF